MNPLDEVRAWLTRYIKTITPMDYDLLALWIAHTHLLDRLRTSPRLIVTSPFPGAGKTTCLEHIMALGARTTFASNALTAPAAARLAGDRRTILIDEADKTIGSGSDTQRMLLGIVNAGYKHSGTYLVTRPDESDATGWSVAEVPVFGALAMAGISPELPEDTRSRSVVVRLLPDINDSVAESDWETIEADSEALRERLATWASGVSVATDETLPAGVVGRLREVWRPLKRAALAAGGDWAQRCDDLAQRHVNELILAREEGLHAERPHVALVRDVFGVWHLAESSEGYAPTVDLLAALHSHSPATWGEQQPPGRRPLTSQRMGRMLVTNYGIHATRQRGDGPRGYLWAEFLPVWHSIGLIGMEGVTGHAAA
ncbi:DUF3631 domain-containing protein [Nocardioides dongxiaopingii]|uniref:DUF3631 domain-containing protein n=1 Tax=Nocardioides dongxiaopingii TaxID=2576036 RepID=UPI0010C76ED7|nr:DUF3631 domain-containing protein [Nocardioides dongxiaopingii]